jgi:hypothetical protein
LEELFVVLLCWPSFTVKLWTFLVILVVFTRFVNLLRTVFESLTPACEKKNKMFSCFVDALESLNDDIEVMAEFDCCSRGFWFCFRTVQNLSLLTENCVSFHVEFTSNYLGIVGLTFTLRKKSDSLTFVGNVLLETLNTWTVLSILDAKTIRKKNISVCTDNFMIFVLFAGFLSLCLVDNAQAFPLLRHGWSFVFLLLCVCHFHEGRIFSRANHTLVLVNWPFTPFLFEPLLEELFVVFLCWPSLEVRLWTFLVTLVVFTRFVNFLRIVFENLAPACEKKTDCSVVLLKQLKLSTIIHSPSWYWLMFKGFLIMFQDCSESLVANWNLCAFSCWVYFKLHWYRGVDVQSANKKVIRSHYVVNAFFETLNSWTKLSKLLAETLRQKKTMQCSVHWLTDDLCFVWTLFFSVIGR